MTDDIRNIDQLVTTLPDTVRQVLADLHGAPDDVAETTIALLPFGPRALLEAVKVTRTTSPAASGDAAVRQHDEPRQRIELTHWGRRVIAACKEYGTSTTDEQELVRRAAEMRARLSAVPPAR